MKILYSIFSISNTFSLVDSFQETSGNLYTKVMITKF